MQTVTPSLQHVVSTLPVDAVEVAGGYVEAVLPEVGRRGATLPLPRGGNGRSAAAWSTRGGRRSSPLTSRPGECRSPGSNSTYTYGLILAEIQVHVHLQSKRRGLNAGIF